MIAAIQIGLGVLSLLIFLYGMLMTKGNTNQYFILYTLYMMPYMNIDIIPGIHSMSIFEVSTLLFMFAFYVPRTEKANMYTHVRILIFLLLCIIFFGCINADEIGENTIKAIVQIGTMLMYGKILLDELTINQTIANKMMNAISVCLIFSLIFLVAQFIFGTGFTISKSENINVAGGETFRYPSFFQDPQKYAQFLSMAGLMLFYPYSAEYLGKWIQKLLPYIALAALLMTGSRAALGGMIAGFIYIFFKKGKGITIIWASMIIIPLIVFAGNDLPIFKRASLSESYDFRNDIWKDAIEIYKMHPIWGIGAGNYADYVRIHNPDQFWIGDNEMIFFDHPESGYLKLLVEYGILGFLAIFLLVLIPIIKSMNSRNTNSISLVAALCSWIIGFYTLYSLGDLRIGIMVVACLAMTMNENRKEFLTNMKNKR